MTSPTATPAALPGCTCHHAAGLHQRAARRGEHPDTDGCRVGWSGAGQPVPGAPDVRHWPAGCTCTAVGPREP